MRYGGPLVPRRVVLFCFCDFILCFFAFSFSFGLVCLVFSISTVQCSVGIDRGVGGVEPPPVVDADPPSCWFKFVAGGSARTPPVSFVVNGKLESRAVSYTHLTLPTNREV